jgi:Ala-tRNA(Pro) deacylase
LLLAKKTYIIGEGGLLYIMTSEERVYRVLDELGIKFAVKQHPPVYTVGEAERFWNGIPGTHCKNLFLRDQRGKKHYLVVMLHDKKADMAALAERIGDGKLSFASERRLEKYLGLTTGAVSPFGLINDHDGRVRVILDEDLKGSDSVSFHPNVNTATVTISFKDFQRFLDHCKNEVSYLTV